MTLSKLVLVAILSGSTLGLAASGSSAEHACPVESCQELRLPLQCVSADGEGDAFQCTFAEAEDFEAAPAEHADDFLHEAAFLSSSRTPRIKVRRNGPNLALRLLVSATVCGRAVADQREGSHSMMWAQSTLSHSLAYQGWNGEFTGDT